MTDTETLDRARQLFVGDTQGDRLARDVIRIAERFADTEAIRKAGDELREEMESTSEECMSAGWLHSLEHILWDAIESGQTTWANGTIDTARLKDLSDRCGGWWVWDEEMGQPRFVSLATWPVIQRAKQTFVLDTPTERLARELIGVAERSTRQRDELQGLLTPLRDAALFARSKRRPMGIGQDFPRAPSCVSIQLGAEYGRERDNVGFWIESDDIAHTTPRAPARATV